MGPVQGGIDAERVNAWFAQNVPGAVPPLRFDLVAGGRSNLTFRVEDTAGTVWALRRPPTGGVLPTAHDMAREWRIVSALGADGRVPVPPAVGFCGDAAVTGAPFYVMGFVEGHVLRDVEAAAPLVPAARATAAVSLVDVLVALHAVDPGSAGLGDLGRREGYVERQLRRWHGQFERTATRPLPLVTEVYEHLLATVPEQGPATIVHGDYRLDNAVVDDGGRVRAVLDWELCTLGDPLADVGLLGVYWTDAGDDTPALLASPTTLPGFPSRAEVLRGYGERSGRDLSRLGFYVALGYWKLACILEGVHSRYLAGAGGGDPGDVADYGRHVERLAERARAAAAEAVV